MTGKYRDGLEKGTPRKAVRPDEVLPPSAPEQLPELPPAEPTDLALTWRERLALWLPGLFGRRETLSLQTVESLMNGKTTWIGIVKVLMGLLGTILAGSGIDVNGGTLAVSSGTAPLVIGALIAYFVLSGVQAYLTQDRDGGTVKTTVVGIIKSASGVLGTVLMSVGLDIGANGQVAFDAGMSVWVILLYLAYLILSAVQAILTRDREQRYLRGAVL